MSTASGFSKIVKRHRRRQLTWTRSSVRRIDKLLKRSAAETAERLKVVVGTDSLQEKYLSALLSDLNRVIDNLSNDYRSMLPLFLVGVAQIAADREADTAQLVLEDIALQVALDGLKAEITKSVTIGGVGEVSVTFGRVAEEAVNAIAERVFKDGLNLSDRLWRLDAKTRRDIEDKVIQAVTEQKSARKLEKELRQYLTDKGLGNARYNATRLAQTEINHAHREATIRSATDGSGMLKSHLRAISWRLSISHPRADVCDLWASQDIDGLGPGNYLPENVPVEHPGGLCNVLPLLVSLPDEEFVVLEPKPDDVPESEKKRV